VKIDNLTPKQRNLLGILVKYDAFLAQHRSGVFVKCARGSVPATRSTVHLTTFRSLVKRGCLVRKKGNGVIWEVAAGVT
jgi:hypothetical protein